MSSWTEASRADIEDYEDWRRFAQHNPRRIGGAKWDRELSVLASLYTWATEHQHVRHSPIVMKRIVSRDGTAVMVPAARAKDARRSNVHWLTPRSWRRWIDIGLRGHTRDGMPEPGWVGTARGPQCRLCTADGHVRASPRRGWIASDLGSPCARTRHGSMLPRHESPPRSPGQKSPGRSTSPPMLSLRSRRTAIRHERWQFAKRRKLAATNACPSGAW